MALKITLRLLETEVFLQEFDSFNDEFFKKVITIQWEMDFRSLKGEENKNASVVKASPECS